MANTDQDYEPQQVPDEKKARQKMARDAAVQRLRIMQGKNTDAVTRGTGQESTDQGY